MTRIPTIVFAFLLFTAVPASAEGEKLSVELGKGENGPVIRVMGLSPGKGVDDKAVRVEVKTRTPAETDERPSLAGRWIIRERELVFEPRFPLSPGVTYRVAVDLKGEGKPQFFDVALPPRDLTPVTKLSTIYPTNSVLPENQLRFYLQFSGPMSRGEAYKHIQLLDEKGKVVPDVFLEIDEELWDPTMSRLTLLFDPGRIKNGLKPREDLGPTLEQGKKYTLVVSGDWHDGEGRKLTQKEFRKAFTAGPPDTEPIDPQKWKVTTPDGGTREPLRVRFGESLDYGLLQRVVWVIDKEGRKVDGTIELEEEEACWKFTPSKPWDEGRYKLVADTILEDLAANRIGRAFEVDVFKPVTKRVESKTIEVPFGVRRSTDY